MKHCRKKEILECIYLTKENQEEFIEKVINEADDILSIKVVGNTDEYIIFEYKLRSIYREGYTELRKYHYNEWMVRRNDSCYWNECNEELFNKIYELID